MNKQKKSRWERSMHRSNSILFRFLLLTVFTGLVSPFALGESSSTSKGSIFPKPRSLAARVSTVASDSKKSRARVFLEKLDPRSRRQSETTQLDTTSLSVASRLLFSYVTPLVDLASNRTLTEKDAFVVPEKKRMEYSVETLGNIYERFRKDADINLATSRGRGLFRLNKSKSFILLKAILYHQRRQLVLTGILRLANTVIQAFPALLVSRLLRCIEAGSYPADRAIKAALLLVFVLCLKMIVENQFFHNVVEMSTQTRGSLEGLIFDKSLRLPNGGSGVLAKRKNNKGKKALGSGGVLNLMQSDAAIIESAAMQIHTIWDGLLQIVIYTSLLFKYLGPSVFWGISVLLSVIPLNSVTLRVLDQLTQRENEAKDARTRRSTESITNMKLLKVQAWEKHFADDIRQHRRDELARHKARGMIRSLNSAISNCVPSVVLVVTLTVYARTGNPIVASTIFTAISLFNQLRFPLFFYPMLVDSLAKGKNSLRRISSYLASEELTPYTEKLHSLGGGSIEIENGNFLWPSSDVPKDGEVSLPDTPALCNVNLKVESGEIVAVLGTVGSGKTALLLSLLGELAPVPRMVVDSEEGTNGVRDGALIDRPTVKSHGNVAYCSQDAWISQGTIRDAVVFGRDFDEEKYTAAVYDAGLDQDIRNGVFSHETDVGEGGSNLSGGQRARVALARALYSGDDTKVFLLDDCLAALDASMASLVFGRLRTRLKRSNAATLLVTNDPSLPRQCDRVVLMGQKVGSSISSCSTTIDIGTYDDLLARGHQISNIIVSLDGIGEGTQENVSLNSRETSVQKERKHNPKKQDLDQLVKRQNSTSAARPNGRRITEVNSEDDSVSGTSNHTRAGDGSEDVAMTKSRDSKILTADELMSKGAVPMATYLNYLKAVRKPSLIAAMLVAFVATNGAQFFQQYTVAKWTELAHGGAVAGALGGQYLKSLVYAAGAVSVLLWFRSYFTMLVGLRASDFYYDRMLESVFRAPMSFFDSTPSGQVLSRFGKEMETIDRALPESYASVLFCALQISSSVLALAGAVTPTMVAPITFASFLYYKTMRRFRSAARDIKRSDTKTRSPIFTHFGEALRGTATIRSIPGAARTWSNAHRRLSDKNLSVYSTVKALDRWLSTRLEGLGNFMVLSTALASVFLSRSGRLLPGKAGWGLTQSLAITGLMAWAVRNLTMLESHMMSVMRVREMTYLEEGNDSDPNSQKLMPKELSGAGDALKIQFADKTSKFRPSPKNEKALIAAGWPWKGGVSFQNVSMRYNPASPLVLKKLNFDVPPGSTLGVVGRTGSGKSSLLLTLFRIVEIDIGGCIQIDSVDIRSVGLNALRESLSIIPQDPVLFTGTVRTNLDPINKRSDDDMWKSLEAASPELARQFHSTGGLETRIAEGGGNFSQGQRQLLCLARALLRSSKILVLDEATSSVDSSTDKQVQDTIRSQFVEKGVTVITVAHRLDTIMNYDKVAVLGDGELIEYGVPAELANKASGEFKRLIDADRKNKMLGAKSGEGLVLM